MSENTEAKPVTAADIYVMARAAVLANHDEEYQTLIDALREEHGITTRRRLTGERKIAAEQAKVEARREAAIAKHKAALTALGVAV